MREINLDEARARLPDLVEAAMRGEEIFIVLEGERLVQLVPIPPKRRAQFGSAKGLITISDDFDAPLPDFDEYTP